MTRHYINLQNTIISLRILIFGQVSNFVSLPWKLDNPYYHIVKSPQDLNIDCVFWKWALFLIALSIFWFWATKKKECFAIFRLDNWVQDLIWSWTSVLELSMIRFACAKTQKEVWEIFLFSGKGTLRMYLPTCCAMITYFFLQL